MEDTISRQAAIDAIKEYIVDPNHAISEYEDNVFNYNAGLKSAVQTIVDLPSAQPESCEDAVSRRKAFEYFVSLWECIGTIMDREEWEDVCKTTANEIPSVTPKRKTGKWIDDSIFGQLPVIVCDQCKVFFPLQFGDSHNFCPNCGADMRQREENK